ncbi:MAG: EamA family transporter [Saprospiraceae bacterium]
MSNLSKPYFALSLTCIIWGTTYLVNKLGVGLIPPFLFTSIRHLFAGIIVLSYVFIIKKNSFPDKKYMLFQAMLGFFLLSLGNGVGVIGLKYIDSGLSAILAATSPILIALLVHFYTPHDKLGGYAWFGLFSGFIGLVIICANKIKWPMHLDSNAIGIGLTFVSVLAWGVGTVISKTREYKHSPLMAAGFQMIFGSLPLCFMSLFFEDHSQFHITTEILMVWAYIIVLGSLVAYSAYIYALKYLPAPIVSIQSYINPIIALQLGYFILGEVLNFNLLLGAFLTLLGVFIVNYSEMVRKKRKIASTYLE